MSDEELYGLTPEMELLTLRYCATDAKFWARIGKYLDPTRLAHPCAKMIHGAVTLQVTGGSHPGSMLAVVQRLNQLHVRGKIRAESIWAVSEAFDAACDLREQCSAEVVLQELVPLVRRRMHSEAVVMAMDDFGAGKDLGGVAKLLELATGLGAATSAVDGVDVSAESLYAMREQESPARLATGIHDLDVAIGGGMKIKSLGTVMADSGAGKSQFLISQAAHACRLGLSVVVVTLELSRAQQIARFIANYCGEEVDMIEGNDAATARAAEYLELTQASRGPCHIAEYDAGITTWEDVEQLIEEREQAAGRKVDVLVLDYADKMTARQKTARDGSYEIYKYVWEGLRGIANNRAMWAWTACQPKSRDDKQRKHALDMHHTGESKHKYQISDLFLTINPLVQDNFEEFELFVSKHRGSKARFKVGPVYGDFAKARITSQTLP